MAKQVLELKIKGGLNNNTDPRDLTPDELADARDVMIDNIGRIRTGPSIVAHASASPAPPTTDNISDRSGTSLFAFSHDYKYAGQDGNIIQNGSSNQNSGSIWGGHATSGPQSWVSSSTNFVFTGAVTGDAAITQTAANRLNTGVGGATYRLTYTISSYALTSGSPELKILSGSGHFAADASDGGEDDTILTHTNGTHEKTFVSDPDASSNVFSIQGNTSAQWTFTLDDIKLELISSDSSGDDYLAMYLNTSATNYGFGIYSYGLDQWSSPLADGLRFNAVTTAAEPVFTYVDGVLRIVDKLKGASCYKIHYSYIDRYRWGTTSVYCRRWINAQSSLVPPTNTNIPINTSGGGPYTPSEGHMTIANAYGFNTNVAESGSWNPNLLVGTATAGSGASKLVASGATFTSSMVGMRIRRSNTLTDNTCDTDTTAGSGSSFGSNPRIIRMDSTTRIQTGMVVSGTGITGTANITNVQSSTLFTIDEDVASNQTNTTLTFDDINATAIITGFESATIIHVSQTIDPTESSDFPVKNQVLTWVTGDTFQIFDWYELGFTWVYDGNQESLIHNRTAVYSPTIKNFTMKIDTIAAGHAWDTETTARITGSNMYYRKESDTTKTWYHLAEIDLNKGFRKSNEDDFSITWNESTATTEYSLFNIDFTDPLRYETYETRNGFKSDSTNLLDLSVASTGYSASVIANRTHYIGNVKYADKDGIVRNRGDAMFKSIPNKFDIFSLDRKIEVSVQDGDEITALATYADRILQFKKNKMHLINVSQEIEFLEDTFKFKGVFGQEAVCETDFGIAWVNNHGCYLYDGKEVKNLLEQNGIRKVSSSSWGELGVSDTFKPMIAYLPKQRQLFIPNDHSGGDAAAGAGNAWIYDMVSQGWVLQDGEFIIDDGNKTSNIITDHTGNLVYFIGAGVIKTISTASSAKIAMKVLTADIDFGNPAIRKKVYRVRISYKGDASALSVTYAINGDTNSYNSFEGTSSGSPTGSADSSPLENKSSDVSVWYHAELKPAVPSVTASIYSFQLKFSGTAGATFELNDISIIYRMKSIK